MAKHLCSVSPEIVSRLHCQKSACTHVFKIGMKTQNNASSWHLKLATVIFMLKNIQIPNQTEKDIYIRPPENTLGIMGAILLVINYFLNLKRFQKSHQSGSLCQQTQAFGHLRSLRPYLAPCDAERPRMVIIGARRAEHGGILEIYTFSAVRDVKLPPVG